MIKNYLSTLCIAVLLVVVGCQEKDNENMPIYEHNMEVSNEYKTKLKKASLVFGEILKDKEARLELAEYADLPGNGGQIGVSLAELFFPTNGSSNLRSSSAIVQQFYKAATSDESKRTIDNDDQMDADELLEFIKDNNISITAPYLAERFDLEDINAITVSYYTADMEKPNDPDYKGETPGYKVALGNRKASDYINWRQVEEEAENDWFVVDDDYAVDNPTMVLGSFNDDHYIVHPDPGFGGGGGGYAPPPSNNLLRCPDLNQNSRLTLQMPHFRLVDNIRSWPNNNVMYLWVITGEFQATSSNGTPNIGFNTHHHLNNITVSRNDAKYKRWKDSNTTFIVHNLKYESDEFIMAWGVDRPNTTRKIGGEIGLSDKLKPTAKLSASWEIEKNVLLLTHAPFDKCLVLEDNFHKTNLGYGLLNNSPVYRMSQVEFYFKSTH